VHGSHKQGACCTDTHRLGYHPAGARGRHRRAGACSAAQGLANTGRRMVRFVGELIARRRRAGASGELTLRMGSGFWSAKLIRRLQTQRVRYSIRVRQTKTVRGAIAAIPQPAWEDIADPPGGRTGR
jgi:hypothetical protein